MLYSEIKLADVFPSVRYEKPELSRVKRENYVKELSRKEKRDISDFKGWLPYKEPFLRIYCHEDSSEIERPARPAALICPGGGYEFVSSREGEPVALEFLSRGFNSFVLQYDVAPVKYPFSLLQLAAAVLYLRDHAEEFHINPEKIAVFGFSAGGHLAACLSEYYCDPDLDKKLDAGPERLRPNALVLGYPVITSEKYAHGGSFTALLGENPDKMVLEKMSLEKNVHYGMPPVFLWTTFTDGDVPVENSLLFVEALKRKEIPFELHIFSDGDHGLSLCSCETASEPSQLDPHCGKWVSLCSEWLKKVL